MKHLTGKRGGAPKKTLRDIAITLHYEYLYNAESGKAEYAVAETLRIFGPNVNDPKRIPRIRNAIRAEILKLYPKVLMSSGDGKDAHGLERGRVLCSLRPVKGGLLEGYVVEWGRQEARFVRCRVVDSANGLNPADGPILQIE